MYVTAGDAPDDDIYNNVYCYNSTIDHWTVLPQPNHRRGVIHMLDDKLTIFGGSDPVSHLYHNKVTTYNRDTDSWYSCYPNMLNNRFRLGVTSCNDYVIVMGGMSSQEVIHDSIEIMNYRHNLQWNEISIHLPVPMWAIKPTVSGDTLVIIGYSTADGRSNGCYQISTEEIISSLDQPVSSDAGYVQWKELSPSLHWNNALVPYSNPPVVIGGCSHDGTTSTPDIILYDTVKNLWIKVDSLTSARSNVGVVLINSNTTIVVIGGCIIGSSIESSEASTVTTVEVGTIVPNHQ